MAIESDFGFPDVEFGEMFVNSTMIDNAYTYPVMEGQFVFKMAVQKFPEVIMEALAKTGLSTSDIDLLVPHQANLRISQFVQASKVGYHRTTSRAKSKSFELGVGSLESEIFW